MFRSRKSSADSGASGDSEEPMSDSKDSLDDAGYESLVPNCLKKTHKCKSSSSLERVSSSLSMPNISLSSGSVETSSVYDGYLSYDPFDGHLYPSSLPETRATRSFPFGRKSVDKMVRFSSPVVKDFSDTFAKPPESNESLRKTMRGTLKIRNSQSAYSNKKNSGDSPLGRRRAQSLESLFIDKSSPLEKSKKEEVNNKSSKEGNGKKVTNFQSLVGKGTMRSQNGSLRELNLVKKAATKQICPSTPDHLPLAQSELQKTTAGLILSKLTVFESSAAATPNIFEFVENLLQNIKEVTHSCDMSTVEENLEIFDKINKKTRDDFERLKTKNQKLAEALKSSESSFNSLQSLNIDLSASLEKTKEEMDMIKKDNIQLTERLKTAHNISKEEEMTKVSKEEYDCLGEIINESCQVLGTTFKKSIRAEHLPREIRRAMDIMVTERHDTRRAEEEYNLLLGKMRELQEAKTLDLKQIAVSDMTIKKQDDLIEQLNEKVELLEKEKIENQLHLQQQETALAEFKQAKRAQVETIETAKSEAENNFNQQKRHLEDLKCSLEEVTNLLKHAEKKNEHYEKEINSLNKELQNNNKELEADVKARESLESQLTNITRERTEHEKLKSKLLRLQDRDLLYQKQIMRMENEFEFIKERFSNEKYILESRRKELLHINEGLKQESSLIQDTYKYSQFYFQNLIGTVISQLKNVLDPSSFTKVMKRISQVSNAELFDDTVVMMIEHIIDFINQSLRILITDYNKEQQRRSDLSKTLFIRDQEIRNLKKKLKDENFVSLDRRTSQKSIRPAIIDKQKILRSSLSHNNM